MQPDIAELCAAIRYQHRQRDYAMEQRKRADFALGSFLRCFALGWNLSRPADERRAIADRAAAMMNDGDDSGEWSNLIDASIAARAPFDRVEASAKKEMERLAKQLPVWKEFGEGVRGFGAVSLAVIVGEAGDLSVYPKKGHLWKRMGVAVIDGVRQGGLLKTASKEDWIEHGYNRMRRSKMFVIGEALVKAQVRKIKDDNGEDTGERVATGPYGAAFLARKEYERQRAEAEGLTVAPAGKIPAKRAAEFMSDGHIHRRAQRYMEKRLLRDLWQAWNHRKAITAGPQDEAIVRLPTGDTVEREAPGLALPTAAKVTLPTAHLEAAE